MDVILDPTDHQTLTRIDPLIFGNLSDTKLNITTTLLVAKLWDVQLLLEDILVAMKDVCIAILFKNLKDMRFKCNDAILIGCYH